MMSKLVMFLLLVIFLTLQPWLSFNLVVDEKANSRPPPSCVFLFRLIALTAPTFYYIINNLITKSITYNYYFFNVFNKYAAKKIDYQFN